VDFRTEITNRAENHRIRALFASDVETATVLAEGQFDLVRREIQPSPVWENPCCAQRAQAFVTLESDNGTDALMVANRGLCEYEVLRDGRNTLAVTLLRCVGEVGDWGVFPTPLGQKKGTYTLEYAMVPYETAHRGEAYGLGYAFAGGTAAAVGTDKHEGKLAQTETYVCFEDAFIRMSAMKKAEDSEHVILRLFNIDSCTHELEMSVAPRFERAALTNLGEEQLEELEIRDGKLRLTVGTKKIVTVELW